MSDYGKGKLTNWQEDHPEEALEAKRKAGIQSGKNRRRRKELREVLEILLSVKPNDRDCKDGYEAISIALLEKAMNGDTKRFEVIRDTIGQKPKEEVSLSSSDVINIKIGEDGTD